LITGVLGEDEGARDALPAEAFDALKEAVSPVVAPQFSIGDRAESDALLDCNDVADLLVLERAQLWTRQFPRNLCLMRVDQLPGSQKTSDVVGPERRS
jgi:hypothetical protein